MAILLQVAGFSRSTFYYQCQVLQRNDKYKELKVHICAIYDKHKGRYGYRRITAVLRKSVQQINHKTVQRLMQQLGLKSLIRVKKFRLASGEDDVSVPNILQRNFNASAPNEKWVTDITEFNVKGQKLYLSASMDVYNGEIVACHTIRGLYSNWSSKRSRAHSRRLIGEVGPFCIQIRVGSIKCFLTVK